MKLYTMTYSTSANNGTIHTWATDLEDAMTWIGKFLLTRYGTAEANIKVEEETEF